MDGYPLKEFGFSGFFKLGQRSLSDQICCKALDRILSVAKCRVNFAAIIILLGDFTCMTIVTHDQ